MLKRDVIPLLLLGLVTVAPHAGAATLELGDLPPKTYEIVRLAEGIHAWLWSDPLQDPIEGNALFIVNELDVVVVDTGIAPSTARRMAEELKRITDKPVRYVVNTHWHDDHHGGNQIYRELWPGVEVIGHRHTRGDAQELTHAARPKVVADYTAALEKYRLWLERGSDDEGKPLDEARRRRAEELVHLFAWAIPELESIRPTLPELTFDDALTLHRGERRIEVRWLGRGNTRGDVVVFLPAERIVATGDLVVHPVPFGFGSHYEEWIDALATLAALEVDQFVPGHGPILRDRTYIEQLQGLLRDLVTQVQAAVAADASLEETREGVDLGEWKRRFAGDDERLGRAFDAFFVSPAVERAWKLARGEAPDAEGQ